MAERKAWPGWAYFAGTMLLVVGGFNIIEGIVALLNDKYVVLIRNELYLVDVTSWGWTALIFGVVLAGTGLGLLAGMSWARWTAVVVLGLHALAQVLWLGAYPLWSLLMVALDVVLLFALTAHWPGRRDESMYYDQEAVPRIQPTPEQEPQTVPRTPGR